MGMYDYYHKVLRGYLSRRKCGSDWVKFLRYVRRWHPSGERIYLIQDNLSAHTTPECRREARRLKITFVPIPTNASHLNPIETHFRGLQQKVLTASDYRDWRSLGHALQGGMRELNQLHSPAPRKTKRCLWVRHYVVEGHLVGGGYGLVRSAVALSFNLGYWGWIIAVLARRGPRWAPTDRVKCKDQRS